MNVILNPDRTRKCVISVGYDTWAATNTEQADPATDIFMANAPPIPDGMHTPLLSADGTSWSEANPAAAAAERSTKLAAEVRSERDIRLQACDWTQATDCPLYQDAAWLVYRQALRDVPQQTGFPDSVIWPVAP